MLSRLILSLAPLLLLRLSWAFEEIEIDSVVPAGTPVELDIINDLSLSDSFDAQFDSFIVLLATTPPGWGTGPVCYLNASVPIDKTTLEIVIPPSVGPSGRYYTICLEETNSDTSKDGPSGYEYSNDFRLTGGVASWSSNELEGYGVGASLPENIPCTSYDCVRKCGSSTSCAKGCAGVVVDDYYDDSSSYSTASYYGSSDAFASYSTVLPYHDSTATLQDYASLSTDYFSYSVSSHTRTVPTTAAAAAAASTTGASALTGKTSATTTSAAATASTTSTSASTSSHLSVPLLVVSLALLLLF